MMHACKHSTHAYRWTYAIQWSQVYLCPMFRIIIQWVMWNLDSKFAWFQSPVLLRLLCSTVSSAIRHIYIGTRGVVGAVGQIRLALGREGPAGRTGAGLEFQHLQPDITTAFRRHIKTEGRTSFQPAFIAIRVSMDAALGRYVVNHRPIDAIYVHTQDWTVLLEDAINTLQIILVKMRKKGILPEHMAWSNIAACVWLLCSTDTDTLTWRTQCGFSHRCQPASLLLTSKPQPPSLSRFRLAARRKSESRSHTDAHFVK